MTEPRRERDPAPPSGVLVVDKPLGPTSHDVVRWVRRALGTRAVGHAGTLDPMATGVLVVAVGEATKLVPWLTAADKEYEAEIALGTSTDTLDAQGQVLDEAPLPASLHLQQVEAAARAFVGRFEQVPPAVSAIKVDGTAMHARVRRGERVEAPARMVEVHALDVLGLEGARVRLRVHSGKGFYVRALARDLAVALGTVGHLAVLRRTRSGAFGLEGALGAVALARARAGEAEAVTALRTSLRPLADAWSGERARLLPEGELDARHGRPVQAAGLEGGLPGLGEDEPCALLSSSGELVAVARREGASLRVVRGFAAAAGRA